MLTYFYLDLVKLYYIYTTRYYETMKFNVVKGRNSSEAGIHMVQVRR